MQTLTSKIGVGSDESKIIIVIVLDNNPLQWNSVNALALSLLH